MTASILRSRLEVSTKLLEKIRELEFELDRLFFSKPMVSIAPPPVHFFQRSEPDNRSLSAFTSNHHIPHLDDENIPVTSPGQTYETDPRLFGEILGQRIRDRRLQLDMTQNELSIITDIRRPNITRLEKGQSLPNLATLLKVADALHLPIEHLLQNSRFKTDV